MILLIDNYDSFVYNLARSIEELGFEYKVSRNDALTIEDIRVLNPSHILISPGPCTPSEAGISIPLIQEFYNFIPILGICLGHQAIAQAFGGQIIRALKPVHGKSDELQHSGEDLFLGLKNPLKVGRYHSLIVSTEQFPNELIATAYDREGQIMALRHRYFPVYGVQFHPESILTEEGDRLLRNFILKGNRQINHPYF